MTFVDGFSGGGQYKRFGELRPGSPFVFLKAVSDAEKKLNAHRIKPLALDVRFFFVDAHEDAVAYLNGALRAQGYEDDLRNGRITVIHAAFEDEYEAIVSKIQSRHRRGRSIFLLDQKGWSAVQFKTIRSILDRLPKSEVILTFATDWLISYLNQGEAFAKAMGRIGICESKLQSYVEAKGTEGYQYVIPRLLLNDIRDLTGAHFYSPFFLRSHKAKRDLWIVHLSKIMTARNVMVSSHGTSAIVPCIGGMPGSKCLGLTRTGKMASLLTSALTLAQVSAYRML
jgi:three-Cys-motif partner protein